MYHFMYNLTMYHVQFFGGLGMTSYSLPPIQGEEGNDIQLGTTLELR